ncbi:multidrug ABC transporter ATP-binding protein [Mangrovactinospora gilvigrisea]|uniref:Multidrug ABC transporter ATP-binding protein n=1 Tax=Mangrovactinospora gilvigrisea TaxID=1428644 RepID=A0A1J7BPP3_9ACTN|nr:ABC transporter ATP-binding protein [Mangrovactinospora gilvigrisea]OIV35417.1 multidrug ABC transporter ATP-binding protein [Mangrovactinospora gilvigrisea]
MRTLRFLAELPRAHPGLAAGWWGLILLRGLLPASFTLLVGALVEDVREGRPDTAALAATAAVFVLLQVLGPLHAEAGAHLGERLAGRLYARLLDGATRPPGLAHLESPDLAEDLAVARDFETGMSGLILTMAVPRLGSGLAEALAGAAQAAVLARYAWWAPLLVGGAWLASQRLLRRSSAFDLSDPRMRAAQQRAAYAFGLAVRPPAAKEVRLFGLADWTVALFAADRARLVELRQRATRLRRGPLLASVALLVAANAAFFASLAADASRGRLTMGAAVVFAQAAIGASALGFGALGPALSGAAGRVAAVLPLAAKAARRGALPSGSGRADGLPVRELRFTGVRFGYPHADRPVFDGLDLSIEAGRSLAIVGVNGAGKTTLVKLLCRLYDPDGGAITVDGIDLRDLGTACWRSRLAAVFQDFARYPLALRDNVDPPGLAPDEDVRAALADAGASGVAELDQVLARGFPGGTELSGGQWQRVAIARALCAVRGGAGVLVLDEPTAQLDVRGEAEVFRRVLAAARGRTVVLVSHRFSTVRQADRIVVLEHGRVVESGSHEELMAAGGRYRALYTLQASAFDDGHGDDEHGDGHGTDEEEVHRGAGR